MTFGTIIRRAIRKFYKRNAVLLPLTSHSAAGVLKLQYPFRITDGVIEYRLCDPLSGKLDVELHPRQAVEGGGRWIPIRRVFVQSPCTIQLDLSSGKVLVNGQATSGPGIGSHEALKNVRKVTGIVSLTVEGGQRLVRNVSHYHAQPGRAIDEHYYRGDDYADYERSQRGDILSSVAWVKGFTPTGRVLDVGCATGLFLQESLRAGFDCYGFDVCPWAVGEAVRKVGAERAAVCDLDAATQLPFQGPFDVLHMSDVIEHFKNPWRCLSRLSQQVPKGGYLFFRTGNASSLTRCLFGTDWEGYSDYSHYGIDLMTPESIRKELEALSWDIIEWKCWGVWLCNEDPVHQCLNDYVRCDERFQRLLSETGRGDFINLVARKK